MHICNHKQKINRIYKEKLHYNCIEELPNLRLKIYDLSEVGSLDESKPNTQN